MGNELSPNNTNNRNQFSQTFTESKKLLDSTHPLSKDRHSNRIGARFTSFAENIQNSKNKNQINAHEYINRPINQFVKIIFVENENNYRIEIPILADEEKNLTCGWLMSETIRKFTEMNVKFGYIQNLSNIMTLKTKDKLYTVDHWLTLFERNISVLTNKMILQPFYGNSNFAITGKKIGMTYFDILKLNISIKAKL